MRALAGLAAGLLLCSGAQACGENLGAGTRELSDARVRLVYKIVPDPPVVARHFEVEIALCPRSGDPMSATLTVDAHMPAHKHGMNYRPGIVESAPGRYRAEGLMFHMPGQWELVFELRPDSGPVQRLTQTFAID